MPLKLLGAGLTLAGYIFYRGIKRSLRRGYIGSQRRRIHRQSHRLQFRLAIFWQATAALICLFAGALCLAKSFH